MENIIPQKKEEITKYKVRGLQVVGVHADNAFNNESFEKAVRLAILHKYAANEHVGVAKWRNRTVQERIRSIVSGLPYSVLPPILVGGIALQVKAMINRFVVKDGISQIHSPAAIVEGKKRMDFGKTRIRLGQYAQAYIGTENTLKERSVHAVALHRSNENGGCYFLNLETGKQVQSFKWEELPRTEEVIRRVEELAKDRINEEKLYRI